MFAELFIEHKICNQPGRFAEDALRIYRKMPRNLAKRINEKIFL